MVNRRQASTESSNMSRLLGAACAAILGLGCVTVAAQGLKFAVVAKSVDDSNFVDTWRGCNDEAKRAGDQCVLIGGKGAAHPRQQARVVARALREGHFDALAISVTSSKLLASVLRDAKLPLFTYDSPFDSDEASLSRAYIGTDNLEFGRGLARIARQLRPQGGLLCIMTAAHDPNLAQRVRGIREELGGNPDASPEQLLSGEAGWTELPRCVFNSADDGSKTMREISFAFRELRPDVFISVGHWPVIDATAYRETIQPYQQDIVDRKRIVIVGVGKVNPPQSALLNERLVHGYVSIDFPEMGRQTYLVMKAALSGKSFEPVTHTPNTIMVGR